MGKSKNKTGILVVFLGIWGAHNFYLGHKKYAWKQLSLTLSGLIIGLLGFYLYWHSAAKNGIISNLGFLLFIGSLLVLISALIIWIGSMVDIFFDPAVTDSKGRLLEANLAVVMSQKVIKIMQFSMTVVLIVHAILLTVVFARIKFAVTIWGFWFHVICVIIYLLTLVNKSSFNKNSRNAKVAKNIIMIIMMLLAWVYFFIARGLDLHSDNYYRDIIFVVISFPIVIILISIIFVCEIKILKFKGENF